MISIPTDQRRNLLLLLLISSVGFLLRLYQLDFQSLWYDELCTYIRINGDMAYTFETLRTSPFPPLYYIILNLWSKIFGYSEMALRFPSLLFSAFSIPLIYFLAKSMFGEKEGLISALLLSVSVYSINYAQEAKMYAMIWSFCIGAFLFFFSFANTGKTKHLVGFIIFTLFSVYTLYTGFIFLIVQHIIYFTLYRKRVKAWLLANLLILVSYIPWGYTAYANIRNKSGISWIGDANYGLFFKILGDKIMGINPPKKSPISGIEHFVCWTLIVIALFYLCLLLRKRPFLAKNYISLFMWPCISIGFFIYADMFIANILIIRYLGFLHIPVIIIFAVGICFLSSISGITVTAGRHNVKFRPLNLKVVAYGIVIFLLASSVYFHVLPYHKESLKIHGEDWKGKIAELCQEAGPNDAVFMSAKAKKGFEYYGHCFKGQTHFVSSKDVLTEEMIKETLNSSGTPRTVFLLYRYYPNFLGHNPNWLRNYKITKNRSQKIDFIRMDF